ncbi:ABC transporter ATP-binding protein [Penaeicola halotolerans]|uniref:ABC transporter ATP-binding protein n=1 Tax=Penaeicola halotolerans TaxID=2793196 RepID=UPI001CF87DB1|nr:ABC transporter ATP-binding protein [Penaeicola halotolerans]
MIQISQLNKQYKTEVVLNIDQLEIPAGESFGLVGNNGAGKTTLFRIILDLIRPSAGEVLINGQTNVSDDWKKFTGSFLDERFLVDYLTPDEYFQFVAGLHGYTAADLDQYLSTFDELFNDEIRNKKKYIRDLSKGNLKKVGIAAAMMGNPELVLLDEPFENLDPSSQIRLKKRINQERESRKVTFLISSHDLNHVTEICTRFVILEKGKIVQDIKGQENALSQLEAYFNA